MRSLMIGALSTIVFFATSLATDTASAAARKAKRPICLSVPAPVCPPTLHLVCQRTNPCRGCIQWACLPGIFPPPIPFPPR